MSFQDWADTPGDHTTWDNIRYGTALVLSCIILGIALLIVSIISLFRFKKKPKVYDPVECKSCGYWLFLKGGECGKCGEKLEIKG